METKRPEDLPLFNKACTKKMARRGGWHKLCGEWCSVFLGLLWCGVVWCGVVWCGVVWCGVKALLLNGNGQDALHSAVP